MSFNDAVEHVWQTLLDADDRNSPSEYPEMLLITRQELAVAMALPHLGGNPPAIAAIFAERARQIDVEGWSPSHDDEVNADGELARAASAYALAGCGDLGGFEGEWPVAWSRRRAPKTPERALAIAGALIVAELERLQRRAESIEVCGS